MPGTTTIYALPYPLLASDPPNGAQQIEDLANAVETTLQTKVVKYSGGTAGNLEIVLVTINPGNLAGHLGQDITVTVPGLLAGDYCFFLAGAYRSQIMRTDPICSTPGQISLSQFNADSAAVNMGSVPVYFLIIHHA